jgi:protease I
MRIACVLGPGFEDSEFRVPIDRFRTAGHDVIVIGARRGDQLVGKRGKVRVSVDKSIDEVDPRQFEALFIPGGHSPDNLRGDVRFVKFVGAFRDRPIFAICHGPQLLLSAGMVKGRTLTAWRTVQVDLKYTGANVVDRDVVVDRNLVTSRQPDDIDAFVRESLALLGGSAAAHP